MKIFKNHFEDKATVVAGNWCMNGCQIFHKRDAQKIFDRFEVPEEMRKDVLDAFSDEPFDMRQVEVIYDPTISRFRKKKFLVFVSPDVETLNFHLENSFGVVTVFELIRMEDPGITHLLETNSNELIRRDLAWFTFDVSIMERLEKDESDIVSKAASANLSYYRNC